MLTRLTVRNFKRLEAIDLELGRSVEFVGPTDSGKTTALQALALWDVGVKRWVERYGTGERTSRRDSGVPIHRRDLIAIPVPSTRLLWRNRHVRDVRRTGDKLIARNIRIEICVEGVSDGETWRCGMEFDYANEALLYCRPLLLDGGAEAERLPVPEAAARVQIAYLPPISILDAAETRLDAGAINVRIAEGRTAEVLRNLCYQLVEAPGEPSRWEALVGHIQSLFGVTLEPPRYLPERGELEMGYQDPSGVQLDLACSGRGLQQVLFLLAFLYTHPGSVVLLDEFDAHLETLRQRQVFRLLLEVAEAQGSQIIAASHAEGVLDEAAERVGVIAFVGRPHRLRDAAQVRKALRDIGFDQYRRAEQAGWVLYLEDPADLAILRAFARTLEHPAAAVLDDVFVHYVGRQPGEARSHFEGLREAFPDLEGVVLTGRMEEEGVSPPPGGPLLELTWSRGEIQGYLNLPDVLLAWAGAAPDEEAGGPLLAYAERERREQVMKTCLEELALPRRGPDHPWWLEVSAHNFLERLIACYFDRLQNHDAARRIDYHALAYLVPRQAIDLEVVEKLDALLEIAGSARRR